MTTNTVIAPEAASVSSLAQMRDELRLQIHLAKADARTEWERLEIQWKDLLERKRAVVETASVETTHEIRAAIENLMKEIGEGYERIKKSL